MSVLSLSCALLVAAAPVGAPYKSAASSLPQELGLFLLLLSVLLVVLRARLLLELISRSDKRNRAKAFRWPTALRSFSGGLAAAYVLLLLLPELNVITSELRGPRFLAFDLALLGLLIFKGIQHYCFRRVSADFDSQGEWKFVGMKVAEKRSNFHISLGMFVAYSSLVLLTFPFQYSHLGSTLSVVLYLLTFALHLGFDALAVCEEDEHRFAKLAPRLVAPILLAASGFAALEVLPNQVSLGAFAMLAGIVVYNVFQVEVRKPEETSFVWFVTGSLVFSLLVAFSFRGVMH
jgi:hypothetical protein